MKEEAKICPGKLDLNEAIAAVNKAALGLEGIQAYTNCSIEFFDENNKKRKETFDARLRFSKPDKIYFRGDKFGEIFFGCNSQEFWIRIKPSMSTYWWGQRDDLQNCPQNLLLNPYSLIDTLGIIAVDQSWKLSHIKGFSILTDAGSNGIPIQKIYIDACDDLVKRIEYFNADGSVSVTAELSDYITRDERVVCASKVSVVNHERQRATFKMVIKNPKEFELTDKNKVLFVRPKKSSGYKYIYRLNSHCQFQQQ